MFDVATTSGYVGMHLRRTVSRMIEGEHKSSSCSVDVTLPFSMSSEDMRWLPVWLDKWTGAHVTLHGKENVDALRATLTGAVSEVLASHSLLRSWVFWNLVDGDLHSCESEQEKQIFTLDGTIAEGGIIQLHKLPSTMLVEMSSPAQRWMLAAKARFEVF